MNLNKISLIAAVAALMLTGCNNDLVLQSDASDNTIEFRTVMDKTRASLINKADELTSFYLHAGGTDLSFMNVAAYRDGTGGGEGGSWTYAPKKYWPSYTLDFFAYAPIKDQNMTTQPSKIGSDVEFGYTVPYDQSKSNTAVDLLVAYTKDQNASTNTTVLIDFDHALSSVIFSARNLLPEKDGGSLVFTIHNIEITNLYNAGTYNTDTGWGSLTSNPVDEDPNYIAGIPESGVAVNPGQSKHLRLLSLNDYLMVLPQAIDNNVKVKVVYSAMYQDGSQFFDEEDDGKATVYFTLNSYMTDNEFENSKRYNFMFNLGDGSGSGSGGGDDPNAFTMIELNVEVNDWVGYDGYDEDDNQGGTNLYSSPNSSN